MASPETTLVEIFRIPTMAKACVSALHTDSHDGLKTLRLVRKDTGEALLQCIHQYTLRFDLNTFLFPEALDAVSLLAKTRLSSLRVIIDITHGRRAVKLTEDVVVQKTQLFLDRMGSSLVNVSSIELDVNESFTSDFLQKPKRIWLSSQQITNAARDILATLAPACPALQRLCIICPDSPTAIPHLHCSQLHTLTLSTSNPRLEKHVAPSEDLFGLLQPLLSRLTNLTLLLPPLLSAPPAAPIWVYDCSALTCLDLQTHSSTAEMWASLPSHLRELRCKLCEPPSASTSAVALPSSLRRFVFQEWGPDDSFLDMMAVLECAPHATEVVLQFRLTPPDDPPRLTVHIGDWAELSALKTLHTQLGNGLRLTAVQQTGEEGPGGLQMFSQPEEVGLLFTFMDWDDFDQPPPSLTQYLKALQPCPLFRDISFFSDPDYELLPVTFPNMSKLVLSGIEHARELAPLASCTSLRSLQILMHNSVSAVSLAKALSAFTALTSFKSGISLVDEGCGEEEGLLLTEMLSKSNPGLTVTVLFDQ